MKLGEFSLTENPLELRKELINNVIDNFEKYRIKRDKINLKKLKLMKNKGELPCEEVLLSVCDVYQVEVWVHHGISSPVVYKTDDTDRESRVINLQCISGIHYNPVVCRRRDVNENIRRCIKNKDVNYLETIEDKFNSSIAYKEPYDSGSLEEIQILIATCKDKCFCSHDLRGSSKYIISIGNVTCCSIIDTGSQVSIISQDVWNKINTNSSLALINSNRDTLGGISKFSTQIIGMAMLKPKILDIEVDVAIPFAIVQNNTVPCCCILGANFLARNKITMDFNIKTIYYENKNGKQLNYPLQSSALSQFVQAPQFLGNVTVTEDAGIEFNDCYVETDDVDTKKCDNVTIKYTIDDTDLKDIQNNNHAIKLLKKNISENKGAKEWPKCLNQFKRYTSNLRVSCDLLIRDSTRYSSVVIPFPLMAEIIYKVHIELAHIGIRKLIDLVSRSFWHPSILKIASDICTSCPHCQYYKVSNQNIIPPTLKIQTSGPFQLVAMDVMLLPRSTRNNIAVIVAIDHFSKWLTAVPIKDKKGSTIARVIGEIILPNLAKIPNRIISDNGKEFKCKEVNDLLSSYNIQHVYSTPYKASSNGCIERNNRTIIQLLKGLLDKGQTSWDKRLAKALLIHNNTVHSQTGKSPSQFILETNHYSEQHIPLMNKETVATWKEGHPKFTPFSLGQKVLKKVQKIGNKVSDKLAKRFIGPYEVIKVQSNEVSYEIKLCNSNEKIIKAHYRQLKPWKILPEYLENYVKFESCKDKDSSSLESEGIIYFESSNSEESKTDCESSRDDSAGSNSVDSDGNCTDNSADYNESNSDRKNRDNELNRRNNCKFNNTNELKNSSKRKKNLRPILKISEKPLQNYSCSEKIIYNDLINTSGVSSEIELSKVGPKFSTPIFQNLTNEVNLNMGPNLSSVRSEDINRSRSNENFLLWLEQTLSFQEEMLNKIISSHITEDRPVTNVNSKMETGRENSSHPILNINEAEVGESNGSQNLSPRTNSEILQIIRDLSRSTRQTTLDYRKSNNFFLRDIWQRKYMASSTRLEMVNSDVLSELSDIVTPIPIMRNLDSSTPRRVTRLGGTVEDLPHVQVKTLEYKRRK